MFKKVLIANRGEIALRVIWACKELGLKTVAVYSEADRHSLHVKFADQAICIGPPRSKDSYLSVPRDHLRRGDHGRRRHPSRVRLPRGVVAISPRSARPAASPSSAPRPRPCGSWATRAGAKKAMIKAGVPVVPGSPGILENEEQAIGVADDIGYPVIVKASAGGGGRGMRIVRDRKDLIERSSPPRRPRPPPPLGCPTSTSRSTSSSRATSRSR